MSVVSKRFDEFKAALKLRIPDEWFWRLYGDSIHGAWHYALPITPPPASQSASKPEARPLGPNTTLTVAIDKDGKPDVLVYGWYFDGKGLTPTRIDFLAAVCEWIVANTPDDRRAENDPRDVTTIATSQSDGITYPNGLPRHAYASQSAPSDGGGEGLRTIYLRDMEDTLRTLHETVGLAEPDVDALIEKVRRLATAGQGVKGCVWSEQADGDAWDTGCGHLFCLNEGTPSDNSMTHCCFCGGRLSTEPTPEQR